MKRLKILYYFRNLGTAMYMWQVYHIVDELAHYDCVVDVFNPNDYETLDEANNQILKKLRDGSYDLFMTCHNEKLLYISTVIEIKKIGIPTLLFCPDNLLAPFNHEHIAKYFDLVWLTSQETKYLFDKWGCKSVFLPYAANPFMYKPDYSMNEKQSLGFIGTPHGTRMDHINDLVDAGVSVTVHTAFKNSHQNVVSAPMNSYIKALEAYIRYPIGRKLLIASIIDKSKKRAFHLDNNNLIIREPVPFEEMAKYSCAYAAMLSFTDARSTGVLKKPVSIINLRHFELPMSGALQFTSYSDELASYFKDGEEIIMCKSEEEYIERARYWLKPENGEKRKEMKLAARKRAVAEHTWYNRFEKVFELLELK